MLHDLEETLELADAQESSDMREARTRLDAAFSVLEQRIDAAGKALHALPSIHSELHRMRDEHAALKQERDGLKASLQRATRENEKLNAEIRRVSERLDGAIEKIARVLQG